MKSKKVKVTTLDKDLDVEWIVDEVVVNGVLSTIQASTYEEYVKYSMKCNSQDSKINGNEDCNAFNGTFETFSDNSIRFQNIVSTEVACELKFDWVGLLGLIRKYSLDNNALSTTLVLEGPGIRIKLSEVTTGRITRSELEGGFYELKLDKYYDMIFVPDFVTKEVFTEMGRCRMIHLREKENQIGIPVSGRYVACDAFVIEPMIVYGRPILDNHSIILSDVVQQDEASEWCGYPLSKTLKQSIHNFDESEKDRFSKHWIDVAKHEHSSIASFARVTLELMHYGAPISILRDVQSAMMDETKHAQIALSLASHAMNQNLTFGNMGNLRTNMIRDIDTFLRDNYNDACMGEAESARQLFQEAKVTNVDGFDELLFEIATDEARHADLGHDIDAWVRTNILDFQRKKKV